MLDRYLQQCHGPGEEKAQNINATSIKFSQVFSSEKRVTRAQQCCNMWQLSRPRASTGATRHTPPAANLSKSSGKPAGEANNPRKPEARAMKCWCTHAPKGAMATPLSSPFSVATLRAPFRHGRLHALPLPPPRAASGDDAAAPASQEPPPAPTASTTTTDDEFEQRVLRMKSRVGPKKRGSAGARKRKAAAESKAVTLPPVPLREPRSAIGLPVEFGFTAYSERLNGLLATVGLTALLLVELGSGQALVKYHQPPTLFLQVYTIVAAGAVFVKYEKERISVWPGPAPPKPPASGE